LDSWAKDVVDWRRDWPENDQRIIGLRVLYYDKDLNGDDGSWKPITKDDPNRGYVFSSLKDAMKRYVPSLDLKKAVVRTSSSSGLLVVESKTRCTTTQMPRASL